MQIKNKNSLEPLDQADADKIDERTHKKQSFLFWIFLSQKIVTLIAAKFVTKALQH